MDDPLFLYLGTLGAIGVGGLIAIIYLLARQNRPRDPLRPREPQAATSGNIKMPPVQVVYTQEGEILWVLNGRVVRDLSTVTDEREQEHIRTLLQKLSPLSLAIPATTETESDATLEKNTESPVNVEPTAPVAPAPAMPPTPRPVASDDTEMTRPFFDRLRDSIRTPTYNTTPPPRPTPAKPQPLPSLKNNETGIGIPRFDELDALLQQKLAALPDAPPTTIRVGSDGMLEIVVAGQVYGHINDIPDEAVRAAMRDAVAIWNSTM